MYLTIKQHDMFRTLLMGFEIPFRACIADIIISNYNLEEGKTSFEEQKIVQQEYYQCVAKLGTLYLDYYVEDQGNRLEYL